MLAPNPAVFGQTAENPLSQLAGQQAESDVSRTDRLFNEGKFADAIARYLDEEARAVGHENNVLEGYGPFKKMTVEEHE